jgi:hypothetical protein
VTPQYGYTVCCGVPKSNTVPVPVPVVPVSEAPRVNPYPCETLGGVDFVAIFSNEYIGYITWPWPDMDFRSWICSKIRPWYQVEQHHLVHIIWWLFLEIPLYWVLWGKYDQTNFKFGFSSKIEVGYQVEREDLVMYAHFGKVHQNHF